MKIDSIDWSKEISEINYCGYCIDITCVCNGYCFKENKNYLENKKSHIEIQIIKSKLRIKQLEQELNNL
jgi:hypothetical protein